jgi:hypothetical protein
MASPTIVTALTDQSSAEVTLWTYQMLGDAFADADGHALTCSATLGDGAAMPASLHFDPGTRILPGTVHANLLGSRSVLVTSAPSEPPTKVGVLHAFQ